MHLVVLLRWPAPLDEAVSRFANRAGISAYEARTRLSSDPPRIGAVIADRTVAEALSQQLNADGFVAATLPASEIEHDRDRDIIVNLSFGGDAFDVTMRDGRTRSVRYDAISLILQGVRASSVTAVAEKKVTEFSAGRALLTGGLILNKTTTKTTSHTTETRESCLYIFEAGVRPSLAVYERRTNYAFLGAALQPSATANFATVLGEFRRRAPHARFDQRLARAASIGAMPLPPPGLDPGEWKVDVAAAVLSLTA